MEDFDNYLDDGSSLEKLEYAIDVVDDIAAICCKGTQELTASDLHKPLQLAVLRLQQVHKELKALAGNKEGNQ